jgi:putative endonuclease
MAVYMMASGHHGAIYIGVSGHFLQRIVEHRESVRPGFTSRYGIKRLVWFEMHESIIRRSNARSR